jgi:hypothetical protein
MTHEMLADELVLYARRAYNRGLVGGTGGTSVAARTRRGCSLPLPASL